MFVSSFDLFKIGIGPSSSHTVGPMRASLMFVQGLADDGLLESTTAVRVELFGSLGATGHGHGSPKAVVLGLAGNGPETVDPREAEADFVAAGEQHRLALLGTREIDFDPQTDIVMHRRKRLPFHSNAMRMWALDADGDQLAERTFFSVGGGFVVGAGPTGEPELVADPTEVPYPFSTGDQMLAMAAESGLSIPQMMLANELVFRSEEQIRAGLLHIWAVMAECVQNGIAASGVLPGGLKVPRRAPEVAARLGSADAVGDPLTLMDWVGLWALAVNEENAAGGRVVTAPTNGAAGIIPAVLHFVHRFVTPAGERSHDDATVDFLLTAAAIGIIIKDGASISGAEVGCQGEVGSACAMAAAGLAEVYGCTVPQIENAAEIGLEHNLGLTCDPVGGLVQIPCIERNAVASVKAITAARMAWYGDGRHLVSLDKVIKTMAETGADMSVKYKETARGGLALNIVEC